LKKYSTKTIIRYAVFGAVISIAIIFLVTQFAFGFDYSKLLESFSKIQWVWLFAALFANISTFFLEASQLYILSRTMDKTPSFWRSIQLFFIYNFFSYALPSTSGGMPFQIYFLQDDGLTVAEGTVLSMMRGFISVVVRVVFVLVIIFAMLSGFSLGLPRMFNFMFFITLLGFLAIVVLGIFAFVNPQFFTFAVKILSRFCWVRRLVKTDSEEDFIKKGRHFLLEIKVTAELMFKRTRSHFVVVIILSVVSWTMLRLMPYFILLALNESPNFFSVFAIGVLAQMATAWVPTPGAVGAVEGGMIAYSLCMDNTTNIGIFILFYRLTDYYCDLVFGAPISISLLLRKFGKNSMNKEIKLEIDRPGNCFEDIKESRIAECENRLDKDCRKNNDNVVPIPIETEFFEDNLK
jgi:hypothetical protein